MRETINKIITKIERIWVFLVLRVISTKVNTFIARLKGVNLGKGTITMGRLFIHRAPYSKIKIGDNCQFRSQKLSNLVGINKYCIISTQTKSSVLIIGNNCGFSGVTIGCREYISIGSDVMVGANVIITDTDWHSLKIDERRTGEPKTSPTIIEDNVFIGVNSIVLKGSKIGKNSVIGAGSIVSGKIPANVIAAGNPCKVIKNIV